MVTLSLTHLVAGHPGHGVGGGTTLLHYLASPMHGALALVVAVAGAVMLRALVRRG